MLDFFFGVALILFGLTPTGDTIAANGFEAQDVYISTDRPSTITWGISSTNANAVFVTSSSYLSDGKVAVPTRMSWDVGAQTAANYVDIYGTFADFSSGALGDLVVVALLCPKTPYAVPAGTKVQAVFRPNSSALAAIDYTTRTVEFNNGSVGAIMVAPLHAIVSGPVAMNLFVFNDHSLTLPSSSPGSTWIASGATFDVGEIWFGTLQEFKLATDPKLTLIDPTLMRRSHSNQPWPLFLKPYKQWTFNFSPMSNTKAYDSSSTPSFDSVRYSLAAANCALVLPRIYVPGTSTINTVDLNQLACFGKPESIAELAAVQNANTSGLWKASMQFGEAPP